jgi:hypothetical protein
VGTKDEDVANTIEHSVASSSLLIFIKFSFGLFDFQPRLWRGLARPEVWPSLPAAESAALKRRPDFPKARSSAKAKSVGKLVQEEKQFLDGALPAGESRQFPSELPVFSMS